MADRHEDDRSDHDGAAGDSSVFDLFEPPPSKKPNSFGKVPVVKEPEIDLTESEPTTATDVDAAGLQHWTAPPTGQVPAVVSEKDPKAGLWGDVAGPSWHGEDPTWSGPDLADVFADADSIRLDDFTDEEDDEEEDGDFGRPTTPRPARSRPADGGTGPAPTRGNRDTAPPLAAAPGRREARADRSWPADGDQDDPNLTRARTKSPAGGRPTDERPAAGRGAGDHPGPNRSAGDGPGAPVPRLRRDPTPGPDIPTGAGEVRPTWPTSSDPRPHPERPGRNEAAADRQAPAPDRVRPPRRASLGRESPSQPASQAQAAQPTSQTSPAPPANQAKRAPKPGHRPARAPQPESAGGDRGRSVPSIDDIEFAGPDRSGRRPAARTSPDRPLLESEVSRGSGDRQYPPEVGPGFDGLAADYDDDYYQQDEYYDDEAGHRARSGGRNLPMAIGVGAALVAVLLAAVRVGPEAALLLVVVAAVVGVVELYAAMRVAGLRPANLLGIVGTAAAPAAAFYRGDAAFTLIVGLTVIFGFLWYLVGADSERPVLNLSLTMMGILWLGGMAGFGGLMLRADNGVDLLLATVIITVASDTMAYFGGRAYGHRPFHPASPNKTWEGTFTGLAGAVFAGFAIGVTEMGTLWDGNLLPAIGLGLVVGLLAPVGDLAESVVKRDLGIKDMGHLLPGHGGILDRVDALVFALPGAYYAAMVGGLI